MKKLFLIISSVLMISLFTSCIEEEIIESPTPTCYCGKVYAAKRYNTFYLFKVRNECSNRFIEIRENDLQTYDEMFKLYGWARGYYIVLKINNLGNTLFLFIC